MLSEAGWLKLHFSIPDRPPPGRWIPPLQFCLHSTSHNHVQSGQLEKSLQEKWRYHAVVYNQTTSTTSVPARRSFFFVKTMAALSALTTILRKETGQGVWKSRFFQRENVELLAEGNSRSFIAGSSQPIVSAAQALLQLGVVKYKGW